MRGKLAGSRTKRAANASPLPTVLLDVIEKSLKLPGLATKIKKAGERSHSARFSNVVYQTISYAAEVELDEKTG